MSVVFADGFDHYSTPSQKGWWGGVGFTTIAGPGRFSYGQYIASTWTNHNINHYIGTLSPSVWLGLAFKSDGYNGICTVIDNATAQVYIGQNPDGTISAKRGAYSGTVLGTSTAIMSNDIWHYIELYVLVHSSSGAVTVKLDGVIIIELTGVNTQGSTTTNITTLNIGSYPANSYNYACNRYIDDLYVDNAQFRGDCRVLMNLPSAAGYYTQWDPSSGSNYACVDENPPNTTDYVTSYTVDDIDTYTFPDITQVVGTVVAVLGNYYVQKGDAGTRQIAMVTRLSSTDLVSTEQTVPSSWGYLQFIQETKPGGGAWSIQDTKDAEMGMKLVL